MDSMSESEETTKECDQLMASLPTSVEMSMTSMERSVEMRLSPLNDDNSQQSESQLLLSEDICDDSLSQTQKSLTVDSNNSNINIIVNNERNNSVNCYCDKDRDLNLIELQCMRCLKWFHINCIQIQIGRCLQFMTCYSFLCKFCSPQHLESFTRRQTNFSQMCETAIANLMKQNEDRVAFSKDKEIIPFIDAHWDVLTTMPRRIKQTWHNTVVKTMLKESDVFICDNRDINDPHFALRYGDLYKIGPNYESTAKQNTTGRLPGDNTGFGRGFGRGAKRKFGGLSHLDGNECSSGKRPKSELSHPKLPPNGFPTEYPYNKDGYRYILAEPDPHGPFRQEFEESQDLAGKPIPGWLCRKLMPDRVALSLHDRAPQLKVSEDRRLVTGEKGYCMVRATHGVSRGVWYYEVKIEDMPDGSAVRLGWAQELANLQAPLGYDKFGYSWRSRKGTKFHQSKGYHFADSGYGSQDIIGFLIHLPHESLKSKQNIRKHTSDYLPQTYKDKPLVKFKSYLYFEEKDEIQKSIKELKPLPESKIVFYKNGVKIGNAFENIFSGTYYPSASLYKGCTVSFNFGPNFKFPPKDIKFKAMTELVEESEIEQTMSDLIYFIENEGKLRLDIFYGGT